MSSRKRGESRDAQKENENGKARGESTRELHAHSPTSLSHILWPISSVHTYTLTIQDSFLQILLLTTSIPLNLEPWRMGRGRHDLDGQCFSTIAPLTRSQGRHSANSSTFLPLQALVPRSDVHTSFVEKHSLFYIHTKPTCLHSPRPQPNHIRDHLANKRTGSIRTGLLFPREATNLGERLSTAARQPLTPFQEGPCEHCLKWCRGAREPPGSVRMTGIGSESPVDVGQRTANVPPTKLSLVNT